MKQLQIKSEFIELDVVDSTNNYVAKAIVEGKYVPGTAILAHFQHEGRGQRGNIWQSEAGSNLTFSVGFPLELLPTHALFLLSKAISVGLAQAVGELTQTTTFVKWPNDLLVGNRKIAGMLIEIKPAAGGYAIVGIGLNVNQLAFSDDLKATSLALELGAPVDLAAAFDKCRECINRAMLWLTSRSELLRKAYEASLFGGGEWLTFSTPERTFAGRIKEVDDQGRILVLSRQGHAQTFGPTEVKINY